MKNKLRNINQEKEENIETTTEEVVIEETEVQEEAEVALEGATEAKSKKKVKKLLKENKENKENIESQENKEKRKKEKKEEDLEKILLKKRKFKELL